MSKPDFLLTRTGTRYRDAATQERPQFPDGDACFQPAGHSHLRLGAILQETREALGRRQKEVGLLARLLW